MKLLLLLMALAISPVQAALQVTWTDNSDNESGFVVERRLLTATEFTQLTQLSTDSTSYQDDIPIAGETYCYRVGAFNEAGMAYSIDSCFAVPTVAPVCIRINVYPSSNVHMLRYTIEQQAKEAASTGCVNTIKIEWEE